MGEQPRRRRRVLTSLAVPRRLAALALTLVVGWLGAHVLGEYEFVGTLPFAAGALYGLLIAECLVAIGRHHGPVEAAIGSAIAAGSLFWAGYISSGDGLTPIKPLVYVAMGLAVAGVLWRTLRSPGHPNPDQSST
jgi:hypothetical protein